MNITYAKRLKQYSETNWETYKEVLIDHQNDIIDTFGGLDTIVQLCLTNPQFSKAQFDSFKSLMDSKNIAIESETDNKSDVPIKDDNYVMYQSTIGYNKNIMNQYDVIAPNLGQFYRYSLGLVAYYSDNLYFTCLSTARAKYICDQVLRTKIYPICGTAIALILALISQTYWYIFDFDVIYYVLIISSYSVCTFLSLSYLFSVNISIVTFIVQTFDFWYKMYNLMLWIVAGYFLNQEWAQYSWYHVIPSVTTISVYGLLFMLDATSIGNKYKNMFIIGAIWYGMYICISAYFFVDETNSNWNPFKQYNFKHSQINFKSVFISSQLNLCLFIMKPIFSEISRKIKTKYKQEKKKMKIKKRTKDDGVFVQRSYVLYKRPFVHWVLDSNSKLIGMGTSSFDVISTNTTQTPASETVKNETQLTMFKD